MRISLALITIVILALASHSARASLIDFEDLTPSDPAGHPTDASGKISDGYQGFEWTADPSRNQASENPDWASLEGYIYMPGTGTAYSYGSGISMVSRDRDFDLLSLDVGSYYHTGQTVHLSGWSDGVLKYDTAVIVDSAFQLSSLMVNFSGIDRFALWAGAQGSLDVPFDAPHVLCIDNISFADPEPAPVPEPSTLLLLGAGILGFTSMFRKIRLSRKRGLM